MATRTGSAAEFILNLLEQQPERRWRIAELHAECAEKWNVDNFHETLKRLLAASRVKKTTGEGRSAWWSAATGPAHVPTPTASVATAVTPSPDASSGTAAQFILDLLGRQPDLEWRIREILDTSGNRWREANVHNTLTRLLEAGKVKKTLTARQAWWSIVGGAGSTTVAAPLEAPAPSAVPAHTPAAAPLTSEAAAIPVAVSDEPARTANAFIVDLLTRHPDYEMQVADIWEEADRNWKQQTVANTLERLVTKGVVLRVKDGRNVWFSIAG